ncbi:MAG: hypothetical protein CO109_12895, partial [Deltaproteobacteria bacterium CG_4_9_14_3_um_filter_65_9]
PGSSFQKIIFIFSSAINFLIRPSMNPFDVIVVGGGPAGSASAIFLALKGYRVALLDRAKFPRDKVCGEFISPGADPILAELGVLDSMESACETRLQGVAVSAYEKEGFCADYPPLSGRSMTSLSLQRTIFDSILWNRAGEVGVERFEGFQVADLVFEDGRVAGVSGWDVSRVAFNMRAQVVIDAGGRNAVSLRRLGLKKSAKTTGRLALAAHWEGVPEHISHCHMHISPPGYTGLAEVAPGKVNIVLVGAASHFLPLPEAAYEEAIKARLPEGIVAVNVQAFRAGRALLQPVDR